MHVHHLIFWPLRYTGRIRYALDWRGWAINNAPEELPRWEQFVCILATGPATEQTLRSAFKALR